MNRKWISYSMLALFLIVFTATISTASATNSSAYEITLVSHTYDGSTYSTWTYNVSVAGDAPYNLSHWVIAWCGGGCSILDAGPGSWEYLSPGDPDPDTGQYGIAFYAEVGKGETVQFWFTLYGDYAEGTVDVAIKSENGPYYGTTTGPTFTYTFDLSLIKDSPNRMRAYAWTDCLTIQSVKFTWYGPFPPGETPTDNPAYLMSGLTTTIFAPGPYVQEVTVIDAYIGSWYVKAEFNAKFHSKTLYDTLIDVPVPWFTSLPLVLLVTVAFMAFRRKVSTT